MGNWKEREKKSNANSPTIALRVDVWALNIQIVRQLCAIRGEGNKGMKKKGAVSRGLSVLDKKHRKFIKQLSTSGLLAQQMHRRTMFFLCLAGCYTPRREEGLMFCGCFFLVVSLSTVARKRSRDLFGTLLDRNSRLCDACRCCVCEPTMCLG